jgi:hypothetical protein
LIVCHDADRTVCCAWVVCVHCRPPPCADCARDGESTPAEYTCCEDKCELKALCGAHVTAHRQWGHAVSVLVPDDATGAPTPDTLRGVTHCAMADHAGAEGVLTHVCKPCDGALVCRACIDSHLQQGHAVLPLSMAAEEAAAKAAAGLPVLREGLTHQVLLAASYRQQLEVLASLRAVAVEALDVATARTHAAVDAKRAALLADIQAAYDAKVAAVQVGLASARSAAAELATVAATAEVGLGLAASAVMRVHVAASVAASLDLAQRRDGVGADVATLGFEGLSEEELEGVVKLGRVVTGTEAAVGGPSADQVCVAIWMIDGGTAWLGILWGTGENWHTVQIPFPHLLPLPSCRPVHHRCPGVWALPPWCRCPPSRPGVGLGTV